MLLSLQLAFAQRAISGVVKGGDTNDYLIGASVTLKGTTKGTTTDVNDLGGAATSSLAVTLAPTIPVYQKDGSTYAGASGGADDARFLNKVITPTFSE
eukprot:gene31229-38589_t